MTFSARGQMNQPSTSRLANSPNLNLSQARVLVQNPPMDASINDVSPPTRAVGSSVKDEVKHFTLRLPAAPYFEGEQDESLGLTKLRSMSELLTGNRYTIHALICEIIGEAGDKLSEELKDGYSINGGSPSFFLSVIGFWSRECDIG